MRPKRFRPSVHMKWLSDWKKVFRLNFAREGKELKEERRSRKGVVVTSFTAIWSSLTILALSWGRVYNWPDYLHTKYGFPMVWAIHVLSTIAGPVDVWRVYVSNLIIDLVFWLGLLIISVIAIFRLLR